jgi:hypothetical protein
MNPTRAQLCLATAACVLALTAAGAAQQPAPPAPPVAHASNFGTGRADTLADGTVVISFETAGDLKGLVTLTLHPSGTGTFGGEWAFTVAHADNTDPATGEDPELEAQHHDDGDAGGPDDTGEEHPHQAFLTLVHQGSLSGAVSSAVVSFDAAGALNDLSATLSIDQGALEFDGATGTGQATLSGLNLIF